MGLNRDLMAAMNEAPVDIAPNFFRFLVRLNSVALRSLSAERASKRLVKLMRAAPTRTYCHRAMLNFVLSWVPRDAVTYHAIVNVLIYHVVGQSGDMEVIAHIALQAKAPVQLMAVKYLCRIITLNSLYSRSAAALLFSILTSIPQDVAIRRWLDHYLIGITAFIGLAYSQHKYSRRISRIGEALAHPMVASIPWFVDIISRHMSSLFQGPGGPPYYMNMFRTDVDPQSERWNTFYEIVKSENVRLNQFPFNTTGIELVLQKAKSSPGRPKVKRKKMNVLAVSKVAAAKPKKVLGKKTKAKA
jgi:hypothetical protein